jgi:voltage-gated potassium channel
MAVTWMDDEEASATPLFRFYKTHSFVNDVLLIPMFTLLVVEFARPHMYAELGFSAQVNYFFCATFIVEWFTGLYLAGDRRRYLLRPDKIADLVSSIPFGQVFRSVRVVRVLRIMRLLRAVWRAKRYRGPGTKLLKVLAIVFATISAGALAMRVVEPGIVPTLSDALWWSVNTVTTVGYWSDHPHTDAGRIVAAVLCTCGVGVFGYVAGFLSTVLEDPEELELLDICRRLEAKVDTLSIELAEMKGEED